MSSRTLSQVFGRTDRAGNVYVLDSEGFPVTRLTGVDGVYPVGSDLGVGYEHADGIVLTRADADRLGLVIDGAIEEHA